MDTERLHTFRFSRGAGLSIRVNGIQVANDPGCTQPVQSCVGARFGAVGANRLPDARITNTLLDLRALGSLAPDEQGAAVEQAIRTQDAL